MTKEQLAEIISEELIRYDLVQAIEVESDSEFAHVDVLLPDDKRLLVSISDPLR
jgi:hypothetical protein